MFRGVLRVDLISLSTSDSTCAVANMREYTAETGFRRCDLGQLRRKVRAGVKAGVARQVPGKGDHWVIDWSITCEKPVVFRWRGQALHKGDRRPRPYIVEEFLRCRRHCEACKVSKARYWAARAVTECDRAQRTYMGTFTLRPEEHALLDVKVAAKRPIGELSAEQLFRERTLIFGQEVTNWLKRVRSCIGVPNAIRYMLVAEVHDSDKTSVEMRGRPHFHLLVHEQVLGALAKGSPLECLEHGESGELIRRGSKDAYRVEIADGAMVRQTWTLGFSKFVWCPNSRSAFYLCKYVTKNPQWKMRASVGYGHENQSRSGTKHEPADGGASEPRPPQQGT